MTEHAIYCKAYLEMYEFYRFTAESYYEDYIRIHDRLYSVKIASYGLSKADKARSMQDWSAELDETCRAYAEAEREAKDKKIEILKYIMMLDDQDERRILQERYISCHKWAGVAKATNFSRNWVQKIHDRALEHLPDPADFQKSGQKLT